MLPYFSGFSEGRKASRKEFMGCGTEPQREAEFVRKNAKKVSAKRRLFGFLALILNTEKLPFQFFEARLERLVSSLLVSPSTFY